jgi:phage/plasmid-associated DNA primase
MTSNSEIIKDIVLEQGDKPFVLETNSLNSFCENNENINDVVVDKQMSTKIFDDSKLNPEKIRNKKYEIDVLKQWSFKEDINPRDITLIADNMDLLKDKIGLCRDFNTYKKKDWSGTKTIINNYKKQIINGDEVRYKASSNSKYGRQFADKPSCQGITTTVRHTLCKGRYIDTDINNAHVVEVVAICKAYNFNCDKIEYYVQNRDECLQNLMFFTNWDRDRCKKSVLSLLNGGEIVEIFKQLSLDNPLPDYCYWLTDFRDQIKAVHQNVFDHPDFDYHKQILIKDKNVGKHDRNFKGKLINKVLCQYENILIQHAIHYCDSNGIEIGANCFDGLLLKICDQLNDDFLKSMENYVVEQVGIPIKFSIKDMTNGFDLSNLKTKEEQKEISKELKQIEKTEKKEQKEISKEISKELKQIEKTEKKEQKKKDNLEIGTFIDRLSDESLSKIFINNTGHILYKDVVQNCIYLYNDETCLYERLESIDHLKNIFTDVLQDYIESIVPENESQSDFKTKRIFDLKNAKGQSNLLSLVKIKLPDKTKFIFKNFHRKNLFPFQDKVVDFSLNKNDEFFIRKRTKDDFFTFTTDNNYNPKFDKHWLINHAKELLMTENSEYIDCFYTLLAHGLTNDNSIKLIIFWLGEGDNGKSYMMNLYKSVSQDFCCGDSSKAIVLKGNSCLDTEKLILIWKRIGTLSELRKEDKLDISFLKKISGDDRDINVRPTSESKQIPVCIDNKFYIPTNELPTIPPQEKALLNRFACFNFCNVFPKSKTKGNEILSKRDDLFTYLCHLASDLTRNDFKFTMCDEMKSFTRTIKNTIDTIGAFMDQNIELTTEDSDFITFNNLYRLYFDYCIKIKKEAEIEDVFGKSLRKDPYNYNADGRKKYKKINGKSVMTYFFMKSKIIPNNDVEDDDDGIPEM